MYGIKGKDLKWFQSYLTKRKQFIKCRDQNTDLEVLRCGVPQGSILGPFLFLIFINDFKNSTKLLDLIMFADDTIFFYTNKNIKVLFETVNKELLCVNEWFLANKPSQKIVRRIEILGIGWPGVIGLTRNESVP